MSGVRVLVVRGHQATPWELRQWEELPERFDVSYLSTRSNPYDVSGVSLHREPVRALRDFLPSGTAGDLLVHLPGDRYLGLERHLEGVDIVHAEELSYWFAAEAARHKRQHGYRLVLTVWETLPMLDAYRNSHARRYRELTLAEADLFLPATERAREALLLEGVPPERIEVCPPGVDLSRFGGGMGVATPPDEHLILSPARLVWEKGHQDVLRAVAKLKRDGALVPRVLIVGQGQEEQRLRAHATELGIADRLELRGSVPYDEMPDVYARASCLVLASLAHAGCTLVTGPPRCFWEEQFGMVLAEAMAAGLPILASDSGAIREVAGDSATYFSPGDWPGLARRLAEGPLSRPPGERAEHAAERVERYSTAAAASRLSAAYERLV